MKPVSCLVLATLLLGSATLARGQAIERRPPPGPGLPFAEAVRAGDLIFLSGQIGAVFEDGRPRLVEGGIVPETRQAMENIARTLESMGSSIDRVVKCTVMLADMGEWPDMNGVYAGYFPDGFPARSAFGVTALALGARVEIECVAAAGP